MECGICGQELTAKVRVACPTCVRARLYPFRIEQAKVLLEREQLALQVDALFTDIRGQGKHVVSNGEIWAGGGNIPKRLAVERDLAALGVRQDRIHLISEHIALFRRSVDERQREIAARRAAIAQRLSDLASATYNVEKRRASQLDAVKEAIDAATHAGDAVHCEDIRSRVWHCKHAAEVAGLKQRRRRSKGNQTKVEYCIGGVRIYDLRDLNSASPSHLTTSLTLLAGLVVRVANYLAVRLPADITLPHKDYPLPTISHPSSSYTHESAPFPGTLPNSPESESPTASRTGECQRTRPRPRPLHIDRKLPALAKDDPDMYATFVEGVVFLAWDIAWLCRSQGQATAFAEWEDVCSMGKNMYKLLVENAQVTLDALGRQIARRAEASNDEPPIRSTSMPDVVMGYFSHGMARGFLGSAEGTSYMKGWKFQTAMTVVDRVKTHLHTEMQGAEWEVLDEKEWEPDADSTAGTDEGQDKARRWTKLKNRTDQVK